MYGCIQNDLLLQTVAGYQLLWLCWFGWVESVEFDLVELSVMDNPSELDCQLDGAVRNFFLVWAAWKFLQVVSPVFFSLANWHLKHEVDQKFFNFYNDVMRAHRSLGGFGIGKKLTVYYSPAATFIKKQKLNLGSQSNKSFLEIYSRMINSKSNVLER